MFNSFVSFFTTFTAYEDFGDNPTAVYSPIEGDSRTISLSNLGRYNEISAGLNFVRTLDQSKARQMNANIRLDSRFANGLTSMGVAVQVRLQF